MYPENVVPAGPYTLRPPVEADAEAVARACDDPEIARFLPLMPSPYTREDALSWITGVSRETWKRGGADYAVTDTATGELLGVAGLKPLDPLGNGEVGYWVAPWARGRGVATAAVRALAELAFAQGVPRIALIAEIENIASQRVALAAGFRREGVLRAAQGSRDGSRADMAAFARLATDPGAAITPYLPFFPGGELTDGVVRLAPLTPADAGDYHAMASVPDVYARHVPPEPPVRAECEELCRYAMHRWLSGHQAGIAIRDAATGEFAGDIQLSNIVPPLDQAMTGYSLRPEFRGRGFVTRAVELLVEWAFTHTSLRRIVAGTAPDNTASQRVLERAGFVREALVKDLLPGPGGTRMDDVQWSRTR
ncbi:GNAT family N-acetyltransferase [Microtetraspora niveoalba]|uniref:GNAT family N-acetyltransferase n=1 Tax=Microtetraspora niveoalba TaxID=46175 RepID=UPI000833C125|nr:GNAT family N-acetyltransferase [Microtetraspora niveoalba]